MGVGTRYRFGWRRGLLGLAIVLLGPWGMIANFPNMGVSVGLGQEVADAEESPTPVVKVRCVALECYANLSDESVSAEVEFIRSWLIARVGVSVKMRDLDAGDEERERLQKIRAAYKVAESKLPVVYGLNSVVTGPMSLEQWEVELTKLLTVQVFVRPGCSKCAKAKDYLPQFQERYPGLEIEFFDAAENPAASQRYNELARAQRLGGVSFPGFWLCRHLIVGFDSAESTGGRLERVLQRWTYDCEIAKKVGRLWSMPQREWSAVAWMPTLGGTSVWSWGTLTVGPQPVVRQQVGGDDQVPDLPLEGEDGLWDGLPSAEADAEGADRGLRDDDEIQVLWMGRISASRMGMPAFTFLIGLIDGFNPCAMWVLLFLLSVLVNLRDRWKIFAVAGTFVLVSGLAYFAFMAAWLNVLLFVGYLRWVQILLAGLAIVVGVIHIKDFFAFKRGLSLSIPDSAKPGLYARVRRIVMAEHLYGAIVGAMILAVLVNFIELLCTAGLPAMYTQVLTLQGYPAWKNYAYLALYILAYMLDDAIMVGIVIYTLGKRKMQENEGRWLKLLSGVVVLGLGVILLFWPEWLS